jgi:hypothetical protein
MSAASIKKMGQLSSAFSGFGTSAMKGAAALGIAAGALWVVAKAGQEFSKVKWEDMGKAAAALVGLGAATAALGAFAAVTGPGAAVLVGIGAGITLFGTGVALAGKGIEAISGAFAGFGVTIERLTLLDPEKLKSVGSGLSVMGDALGSAGWGALKAGLGDAIGKMFGGDIVSRFEGISNTAPGVQTAAQAVGLLNNNLRELGRLDTNQLTSISKVLKDIGTSIASINSGPSLSSIIGNVVNAAASRTVATPNVDQNLVQITALNTKAEEMVNELKTSNGILKEIRDNTTRTVSTLLQLPDVLAPAITRNLPQGSPFS